MYVLKSGFVRCIDHVEKQIYVSTNLTPDQLADVNVIVKTSVTLPEDIMLTQVRNIRLEFQQQYLVISSS